MKTPAWVNVQVRYCSTCKVDYPRNQPKCPQCGRALVDKTLRVPAQES